MKKQENKQTNKQTIISPVLESFLYHFITTLYIYKPSSYVKSFFASTLTLESKVGFDIGSFTL